MGAQFLVFLRNIHTLLHSGFTRLDSHQQYRGVPFLHNLSSIDCRFLMMAILTVLSGCFTIILISTFSYAFWPPVCLLWKNVYLDILSIFDGIFYLILSCMSYLYWSLVNGFICKGFLPFYIFSFCFVYAFLCSAKAFEFNYIPFILRLFWELYQNVFCLNFTLRVLHYAVFHCGI